MDDILALWPSLAALADDLGAEYPTVASWKWRRLIPPDHFVEVAASAEKRGILYQGEALTVDALHKARKRAIAAKRNASGIGHDAPDAHAPASVQGDAA